MPYGQFQIFLQAGHAQLEFTPVVPARTRISNKERKKRFARISQLVNASNFSEDSTYIETLDLVSDIISGAG